MEFKQRQTIYLQIADHICEYILIKRWKEGDRIPSIREMSVSIEVNPNTVMRSYNYLQDLGIIYNQRGIGYFVAEQAYEKTMELKKKNFIKRDLPQIFKTMELLQMSCDDLRDLYADRTKE